MTQSELDSIFSLLEQQHALLQRLQVVCDDQKRLADCKDFEGLERLLARRRGLVHELTTLAERSHRITSSDAQWRQRLGGEQSKRIDQAAQRIEALRRVVREADDKLAAELRRQRDDTRRDLLQVRQMGKAVTAYGGANPHHPQLTDQRG